MTVTKNTIIAEILNNDPTQGCVPIFLSTGMHCLGCMASHGETVEEACAVLRSRQIKRRTGGQRTLPACFGLRPAPRPAGKGPCDLCALRG